MDFLYIYLAIISFASIIATVADKVMSKIGSRRISEAALLGLSAVGGSLAMIITMLLIRHKTKHVKFMVGIPFIILLQIIVAAIIFFRLNTWKNTKSVL